MANINRQLSAQVPEAIAFAFSPPAIPGFGNAGGFSLWAAEPGVTVLTGDFGKTGKTAIALTGGASWDTMPLALPNGDGTWEITNVGVAPSSYSEFPGWAAQPGVTAVAVLSLALGILSSMQS